MMCKKESNPQPPDNIERPEPPDGPVEADFESLKAVCQKMVARRNWSGLNPHKVKRLCEEYERLKAACEISGPVRARVITTLSWLVADAKHRFDDCKGNLDNGSTGGYSPELTEAVELLKGLEKPTAAEDGNRHHDEDTLAAAYRKGFEEAKKVVLKEIQKLVK